jgi:hypothetical protein
MKTLLTILAAALFAASAQAQLIPQTQQEQDLQEFTRRVAAAEYYSQLAADALNNIGAFAWSLPDARLESLLENPKLGEARVTGLLQLLGAQAQAFNMAFEQAGSPTRVNATPSREFSWSSPTNVVLVPLPTPTPEPSPTPEP